MHICFFKAFCSCHSRTCKRKRDVCCKSWVIKSKKKKKFVVNLSVLDLKNVYSEDLSDFTTSLYDGSSSANEVDSEDKVMEKT